MSPSAQAGTLRRVLVANRGEIAVRILRACDALGLETVLAVSEADRDSLPARMAGRTVCIGPAQAGRSYLDRRALVAAAVGTGADALHPGYGFLAESSELAALCATHGVTFVGPTPEQILRMGNKLQARALARQHGLPILPGSERVADAGEAVRLAAEVGLPVILKAAAGGGGRGMKVVTEPEAVGQAFVAASAEARSAFGDDTLYLERFIADARHVEVQVLGDGTGHVIHLGERDCSLQRRHQKLVEEAPAPLLSAALRGRICDAAVTLSRAMDYRSAGTVEFIVDAAREEFFFLEMNTRIQVEHPVTEAITGVDLVQQQLRIAGGEALRLTQADIVPRGHAIECRITAERPEEGFRPDPGTIRVWQPPSGPGIRVDTHCYAGYAVPIYYDSLLAKLIVWGEDRDGACRMMEQALGRFGVEGVGTTVDFLRHVVAGPAFREGRVHTRLLDTLVADMPAGVA